MLRITLTGDTRQELDRARSVLEKSYIIRSEKYAKTNENERFRQYLFVIPKGRENVENGKNSRVYNR